MKLHSILQGVSKVLKGIAATAVGIWFITPFKTSNELMLNIAELVVALVCFGAAMLIDLEVDIPKPPPGSKYDPSKPLGL